jgi:hypothetical protein
VTCIVNNHFDGGQNSLRSGYSNYRIRTNASNQDPNSVGLGDPDFESGPGSRKLVLERLRSVHPH